MIDHQKRLEDCESALRAGQGHRVAKLIGDLSLQKIPRPLRLQFANVCRRAQLLASALKILTPIIHPRDERRLEARATSAELAEYSVLLIRYGAVREALQKLSLTNADESPEAHLYRAFAHFNRWDYEAALPSLHDYLKADLAPNMRLIGKVNLAAAQVSLRMNDEAFDLLTRNLAEAKKQNYDRLRANCFELRAQVYLLRNDTRRAKEDLEKAAALLGEEKTFDQLFVRKWLAVLEARKTNSTTPLEIFRREAIERQDSESLRDADFNMLKIHFDQIAFHRLYFGTPFAAYRERLKSDLKASPLTDAVLFGDPKAQHVFDLRAADEGLRCGGKIHLLLTLLARDFYRPLRMGALYSELFPGEYFDVYSSPDRVHQLLYRTRMWLQDRKLPVEIVEKGESYRLRIGDGFAFRVSNESEGIDRSFSRIEALRQNYASDAYGFTAVEGARLLGMTLKTFRSEARHWMERGELVRKGSGRATKYVFSQVDARRAS